MGMFDYLKCEAELPGLGVPAGVVFQTKGLFRDFARLTIDARGRLLQCADRPRMEEEWPPGRDLEYHGDLWFYGDGPDGAFAQFVARFTDGRLAWIRPIDTLTELHRSLLVNRY